jgi:hypothetical protein
MDVHLILASAVMLTHQHVETLKKGDYTHYMQSASAYRLKKPPTVPDGEPQIPPPPVSPKRRNSNNSGRCGDLHISIRPE